jgi:hypothetical protein
MQLEQDVPLNKGRKVQLSSTNDTAETEKHVVRDIDNDLFFRDITQVGQDSDQEVFESFTEDGSSSNRTRIRDTVYPSKDAGMPSLKAKHIPTRKRQKRQHTELQSDSDQDNLADVIQRGPETVASHVSRVVLIVALRRSPQLLCRYGRP